MSENTSQRLGVRRCTTHQARGGGGGEEDKILKVGHERLVDAGSPDGINRGFPNPIEGAGEFQWALR
jgi:hypothetical protein